MSATLTALRSLTLPSRPAPARMVLVTAPAELYAYTDTAVTDALRLDSTSDSTYLTLCLAAARRHVERTTGLSLLTQVWRAEFDTLPAGREVELPRAPLVSVSSVTYLTTAAATATLDSANYLQPRAGLASAFATLALSEAGSWPDVGAFPGALRITFTAGFGAAADVPEDLRLAVLYLAAWWYEQRLPVNVGNIVNQVPTHLDDILSAHRVAYVA